MAIEFNSFANPTVDTSRFKIYTNVSATSTPEWELQGRGVTSWTESLNVDSTSEEDVLGYVDFTFGKPKPTQDVDIKLRKDSKLGMMLFDAYLKGKGVVENIDILQKYEMCDGTTDGKCLARIQKGCAIAINDFTGEAGGKLGFSTTWNYTNDIKLGEMDKEDGESISFVEN